MNLTRIEGAGTLDKFVKKDPNFLSKIFDVHIRDVDILSFIDHSLNTIFNEKNITEQGRNAFYQKISSTYSNADELINFINVLETQPFDLNNHLNKIEDLKEICYDANLSQYKWLANYKFPGGANVGSFEAFLITTFKDMSNPAKAGDVAYKTKYTIEVKGSSGRLMGQHGYKNGLIRYLDELLPTMGYTPPTNKLFYNFGTNTNMLRAKIAIKNLDLQTEEFKYKRKLADKEKRMMAASYNKKSKKYLNAKKQFHKFENETPSSITKLKEEVSKFETYRENAILEKISIDLAKKSLNDSIDFFVKVFSRKYSNADNSKIELFLKNGLNRDGSFNDVFFKEYLIFEYEYYQFLEGFEYFCLVNLQDDLMLIIDSNEQFREYVYSDNITIKSKPSVSEHSGQQGMVFAIELKTS